MGPLREQLVLDVHAGDAGPDELPDRAHGMQRLAEPGTGVDDHRDIDRGRGIRGERDLLGHRQQRFSHRTRCAGDVAAGVDRLEPGLFNQTGTESVVNGWHMQESFCPQQLAELRRFFHGSILVWFQWPYVVI